MCYTGSEHSQLMRVMFQKQWNYRVYHTYLLFLPNKFMNMYYTLQIYPQSKKYLNRIRYTTLKGLKKLYPLDALCLVLHCETKIYKVIADGRGKVVDAFVTLSIPVNSDISELKMFNYIRPCSLVSRVHIFVYVLIVQWVFWFKCIEASFTSWSIKLPLYIPVFKHIFSFLSHMFNVFF